MIKPVDRIASVVAHNHVDLLNATSIGMPTLTIHGPPETNALAYIRRTPSTPGVCSMTRAR